MVDVPGTVAVAVLSEAESRNTGAGWAFTVSVSATEALKVPLTPETVIEYTPGAVEAWVATSRVADDVVLAGDSAPVTPAGHPAAVNDTPELKPLNPVIPIMDAPLDPAVVATFDAEIVKRAPDVTVRVSATVAETPPPVPVMVSEYVPAATEDETAIVTGLMEAADTGLTGKLAAMPEGQTGAAANVTGELKPPVMVTARLEAPLVPAGIETLVAFIANPAGILTVNAIVVVAVSVPLLPSTVRL